MFSWKGGLAGCIAGPASCAGWQIAPAFSAYAAAIRPDAAN